MPRINSTAWTTWNPVLAARLEAFNQDIDNIYATGSDHFKVYHLSAQPALQVTIGPGTYRVWASEGQYAGWTLTVGVSVTTYIMINSLGVIQTSTSGWNGQYARLAVVVSNATVITSITDWRNKIVGGELGLDGFWNITSTTFSKWRLTAFVSDGINFTITYSGYRIKTITNGVNTWTPTWNVSGLLTWMTKT